MQDLLEIDACRSGRTVSLPEALGRVRTPLQWRQWDQALARHPDQRFRVYIVEGIKKGFRIGFDGGRGAIVAVVPQNMPSVNENPEVVDTYLAEECCQGRVGGPLDPAMLSGVHVSRFGVIPKSTPGKWRLIVDLSFPRGHSVNDGVREATSTLSYVGVWDAAREIVRLGRGTQLAKVDIKSAYRNVPVHPDDRWLLGMGWRGALFIDSALPFGLRSAPKIFTAIADAAEWIARTRGVRQSLHYLDDFLIFGRPGSDECRQARDTLLQVFEELGIPVAQEKLEGPECKLTFSRL